MTAEEPSPVKRLLFRWRVWRIRRSSLKLQRLIAGEEDW